MNRTEHCRKWKIQIHRRVPLRNIPSPIESYIAQWIELRLRLDLDYQHRKRKKTSRERKPEGRLFVLFQLQIMKLKKIKMFVMNTLGTATVCFLNQILIYILFVPHSSKNIMVGWLTGLLERPLGQTASVLTISLSSFY